MMSITLGCRGPSDMDSLVRWALVEDEMEPLFVRQALRIDFLPVDLALKLSLPFPVSVTLCLPEFRLGFEGGG